MRQRRLITHLGKAMTDQDKQDVQVGKYIQKRRRALHLTQEQLAQRLKKEGLDRAIGTISDWEHGKQHIQIEYLPIIANALEEISPIKLYILSGLFDKQPLVSNVLLLLNTLPENKLKQIERVIDAMLIEDGE